MKGWLAAFLLLFSGTSWAATTWTLVGDTSSGDLVHVDMTTVKKGYQTSYRTAWVRWTYKAASKGGVLSTKEQLQVDCSAETLGQVAILEYGANGEILGSTNVGPVMAQMAPQAPETIGQRIIASICKAGLND